MAHKKSTTCNKCHEHMFFCQCKRHNPVNKSLTRRQHSRILMILVLVSICVLLISSFDIRIQGQYYDTDPRGPNFTLYEDDSFSSLAVSVIYISGCLPFGLCQKE